MSLTNSELRQLIRQTMPASTGIVTRRSAPKPLSKAAVQRTRKVAAAIPQSQLATLSQPCEGQASVEARELRWTVGGHTVSAAVRCPESTTGPGQRKTIIADWPDELIPLFAIIGRAPRVVAFDRLEADFDAETRARVQSNTESTRSESLPSELGFRLAADDGRFQDVEGDWSEDDTQAKLPESGTGILWQPSGILQFQIQEPDAADSEEGRPTVAYAVVVQSWLNAKKRREEREFAVRLTPHNSAERTWRGSVNLAAPQNLPDGSTVVTVRVRPMYEADVHLLGTADHGQLIDFLNDGWFSFHPLNVADRTVTGVLPARHEFLGFMVARTCGLDLTVDSDVELGCESLWDCQQQFGPPKLEWLLQRVWKTGTEGSVQACLPVLWLHASGWLKSWGAGHHHLQDVLSDAAMKIATELPKLPRAENLTGWCFRVVKNYLRQVYRSKARQSSFADPPEIQWQPDFDDSGDDDSVDVVKALMNLDCLNSDEREVLIRTSVREQSVRKTAELLGVSQSTIGSWLDRAKRKVRTEAALMLLCSSRAQTLSALEAQVIQAREFRSESCPDIERNLNLSTDERRELQRAAYPKLKLAEAIVVLQAGFHVTADDVEVIRDWLLRQVPFDQLTQLYGIKANLDSYLQRLGRMLHAQLIVNERAIGKTGRDFLNRRVINREALAGVQAHLTGLDGSRPSVHPWRSFEEAIREAWDSTESLVPNEFRRLERNDFVFTSQVAAG